MDREGRAALWTFVGLVVGFKILTSIVIFMMAPSAHNALFQLLMNLQYLAVPVVLVALPAMFWFRLMRVRAKRRQLMRSEWQVDWTTGWNSTTARGTIKQR